MPRPSRPTARAAAVVALSLASAVLSAALAVAVSPPRFRRPAAVVAGLVTLFAVSAGLDPRDAGRPPDPDDLG